MKFKIGVSKVQDFGNFELSPMHCGSHYLCQRSFGTLYHCSIFRSEVATIFSLSWLITWFGHVLNDLWHIVRCYDFLGAWLSLFYFQIRSRNYIQFKLADHMVRPCVKWSATYSTLLSLFSFQIRSWNYIQFKLADHMVRPCVKWSATYSTLLSLFSFQIRSWNYIQFKLADHMVRPCVKWSATYSTLLSLFSFQIRSWNYIQFKLADHMVRPCVKWSATYSTVLWFLYSMPSFNANIFSGCCK